MAAMMAMAQRMVPRTAFLLRPGPLGASGSSTSATALAGAVDDDDLRPDAVVCGAGVAGVASAYYLATNHGLRVALIDERPPLSYTSSYSTECYRNYWAGNKAMTAMTNRSIDLLEQHARDSDNRFSMNRRGYAFLTAREEGAAEHLQACADAEEAGIGSCRIFTDGAHGEVHDANLPFDAEVDGIDLFVGQDAIQAYLPGFVSPEVKSLMLARRCGWMNAQQMGSYLLEEARATGLVKTYSPYSVTGLAAAAGGDGAVEVQIAGAGGERTLSAGAFVNCAGPLALRTHRMVPDGVALPIKHEVHAKTVMNDFLGVVPGTAPMMIWNDEVQLKWSDEEREMLAEMGEYEARLVEPLPAGVHFRPYPGAVNSLVMLWEFAHLCIENADVPVDHPQLMDHLYPELVLRGLSEMVPGLERYLEQIPSSVQVDGGYYSKVPDNKPVVGAASTSTPGFWSCVGLSGFGIMASNACGELVAAHVAGSELPGYADAFAPNRWDNPQYVEDVRSGKFEGLQI